MKVIIIGGFLGAGKTTLLLQLAAVLVEQAGKSSAGNLHPVVILENEISSENVDDRLLSRTGFQVRNIISGCICCSSSAQLSDSVRGIEAEFHPEWLVIEATGLAYPDAIQETLQKEALAEAGVICLVDASRWLRQRRAMPQFVNAQLNQADVILVNKVDLAGPEQLEQVRASLRGSGDSARVLEVSLLQNYGPEFWEDIIKGLEVLHG